MNTKLTLTLEKEIIEAAKHYASGKGKSLSEMVESYFRYLTASSKEKPEKKISAKVNKLKGCLKVSDDFDYKKVLESAKDERYDI